MYSECVFVDFIIYHALHMHLIISSPVAVWFHHIFPYYFKNARFSERSHVNKETWWKIIGEIKYEKYNEV